MPHLVLFNWRRGAYSHAWPRRCVRAGFRRANWGIFDEIKGQSVPYKGTGPAITDLIGGHVAYQFGGVSVLMPFVGSGKLRALALSTARRSAIAPEIPTIAESGLAGYAMSSWNSLVAPHGVPRQVIERLNAETVAVLNQPEIRERLKQQGVDADPGTPAQLAAHIKTERERFARLIAAIGLKID